ncbi:hypothetical protein [Clostridium sp.]|uniref:hypothetical protein n=1 Tax=Clostridium sp. TaxID=1506 RepID=UPI00321702DC
MEVMEINSKSNVVDLVQFINNKEITQGVVYLKDNYHDKSNKYFFHKLKCEDDTLAVFVLSIYNKPKIDSCSKYEYLMSIDNEDKFVLYKGYYNISDDDFKLTVEPDYKVFSYYEVVRKMQEEYIEKVQNLYDNNFNKFMTDVKFTEEYNIELKNIKRVEDDYLNNNKTTYNILYGDRDIIFELDEVIAYLRDYTYLNEKAEKYFNKNKDKNIRYFARVAARRKVLVDIKENPSERVIFIRNVKNAIQEGGKTLNILTKDGNKCKVENRLLGNEDFRTCTGWNFINIKDVQEIKFGRNILYKSE